MIGPLGLVFGRLPRFEETTTEYALSHLNLDDEKVGRRVLKKGRICVAAVFCLSITSLQTNTIILSTIKNPLLWQLHIRP